MSVFLYSRKEATRLPRILKSQKSLRKKAFCLHVKHSRLCHQWIKPESIFPTTAEVLSKYLPQIDLNQGMVGIISSHVGYTPVVAQYLPNALHKEVPRRGSYHAVS